MFFLKVPLDDPRLTLTTPKKASHIRNPPFLIMSTLASHRIVLYILIQHLVRIQLRAVSRKKNSRMDLGFVATHAFTFALRCTGCPSTIRNTLRGLWRMSRLRKSISTSAEKRSWNTIKFSCPRLATAEILVHPKCRRTEWQLFYALISNCLIWHESDACGLVSHFSRNPLGDLRISSICLYSQVELHLGDRNILKGRRLWCESPFAIPLSRKATLGISYHRKPESPLT